MIQDERLYAFIVARTSRSHIRRIAIHRRWLKATAGAVALLLCAALYGVYAIANQAISHHAERENNRLRAQNEKQRQQLDQLENRVDAIEDASRKLAEISGVTEQEAEASSVRGAGGPLLLMDAETIAAVEHRAAQLEQEMSVYASVLRERARIPSIWPVEGEVTDYYGVRRNPFGGGSSEFHSGQDISAPTGTPVVAAGSGTVYFAGTQSGYGQIVIIDHGNGLTTRYGHLSRIEVEVGRELARGEEIGRVGSTGRSTGPHLHYEVRINETAVSPWHYLPERSDGDSSSR